MTDNFFVCTPDEFLAASFAERRKLVVAQIDATPHLHNQDNWAERTACGTTRCAAGWACTLAGATEVWGCEKFGAEDHVIHFNFQGVQLAPEDLAGELLGLDDDEADLCFFDTDTRDEVAEALGVD